MPDNIHKHIPDDPPVAATESGGPMTGPGVLDPAHKWTFEVLPGFFMQTGPEPKHVRFEELVSVSGASGASGARLRACVR